MNWDWGQLSWELLKRFPTGGWDRRPLDTDSSFDSHHCFLCKCFSVCIGFHPSPVCLGSQVTRTREAACAALSGLAVWSRREAFNIGKVRYLSHHQSPHRLFPATPLLSPGSTITWFVTVGCLVYSSAPAPNPCYPFSTPYSLPRHLH